MLVHNPNKLPTISIADLIPTQGDLKDLSTDNYEKLKKNIERRGFIDPVAVWEDKNGIKYILNGHQRQRVLTNEGWLEPIPYFNVPAKTLQEAAAIVLELTSQYGKITQEGLDAHIAKYDLPEAEIYEATHFDALSFYDTSEPEQEVEEDEAPEVDESEPPKSELGKIYQLGRHRVMCGDSTDKANVELLMNGNKADMVFTDPPYGMNLDTDYSKLPSTKRKGNRNYSRVIGDDKPYDPTHILEQFSNCDEIIMFGADYYAGKLPKGGSWYVWDKRVDESFDNMIGSGFELAWSKSKHKREIARFNNTLFSGEAEAKNKLHPTQKPTKMIAWFFERLKGIYVIDLFLGSGSTLIACEQTDRTCYGMELDPKYVDVIRKRYAKFIQPDDQLPENWEELTPAIND